MPKEEENIEQTSEGGLNLQTYMTGTSIAGLLLMLDANPMDNTETNRKTLKTLQSLIQGSADKSQFYQEKVIITYIYPAVPLEVHDTLRRFFSSKRKFSDE